MRRLESIDDEMRGLVTYELTDGRRVCVSERDVRERGAMAVLGAAGVDISAELPSGRQKVTQSGVVIGTLPADFDPTLIRPGLMYDPRPGDLFRGDNGWIASPSLGGGDMEYIPGFRPA